MQNLKTSIEIIVEDISKENEFEKGYCNSCGCNSQCCNSCGCCSSCCSCNTEIFELTYELDELKAGIRVKQDIISKLITEIADDTLTAHLIENELEDKMLFENENNI